MELSAQLNRAVAENAEVAQRQFKQQLLLDDRIGRLSRYMLRFLTSDTILVIEVLLN